ncbi:MAG: tetratricopeptide repeat protein, partial [Alphaproteobacteria bacterium]|nr:tetratricopeptide repeat protein [Alphaproteobacteria bacterium]
MNWVRGLASVYSVVAVLFAGAVFLVLQVDATQARLRFEHLRAMGAPERALGHGERALALLARGGEGTATSRIRLEVALAEAYEEAGRPDQAARRYQAVLDRLSAGDADESAIRGATEHQLIRALLEAGEAGAAAARLVPHIDAVREARHLPSARPGGPSLDPRAAAMIVDTAAPLFAGIAVERPLTATSLPDADAFLVLASYLREGGHAGDAAARLAAADADLRMSRLGPADPRTRAAVLMAAEIELARGLGRPVRDRLKPLIESPG